jgi:ferredoxin-NADP reductase
LSTSIVLPNLSGLSGFLTTEILAANTPEYLRRQYYLSGPSAIVDRYSAMLTNNGIKRRQLVTDHFSGY